MHCKSSPWCELPSLLNLDSLAAISSDVAAISRISSELLGRAAADSVRDGLVRFFPLPECHLQYGGTIRK